MPSPQPYTVQADTEVTWGGETTFVRKGTIVEAVPGSALFAAYGGGNLAPLTAAQAADPSVADKSTVGD
jgi:hypothetical protein